MIDTLHTLTSGQAAGLICRCGDLLVDDHPSLPPRGDGRRRGMCGCFRARRRQIPVAAAARGGAR